MSFSFLLMCWHTYSPPGYSNPDGLHVRLHSVLGESPCFRGQKRRMGEAYDCRIVLLLGRYLVLVNDPCFIGLALGLNDVFTRSMFSRVSEL